MRRLRRAPVDRQPLVVPVEHRLVAVARAWTSRSSAGSSRHRAAASPSAWLASSASASRMSAGAVGVGHFGIERDPAIALGAQHSVGRRERVGAAGHRDRVRQIGVPPSFARDRAAGRKVGLERRARCARRRRHAAKKRRRAKCLPDSAICAPAARPLSRPPWPRTTLPRVSSAARGPRCRGSCAWSRGRRRRPPRRRPSATLLQAPPRRPRCPRRRTTHSPCARACGSGGASPRP